jgi:hypothetical protein
MLAARPVFAFATQLVVAVGLRLSHRPKPLHEAGRWWMVSGEKLLLGNNASPLVIHHGQVSGDPVLVLHPPRLFDPPLVMGLPLL